MTGGYALLWAAMLAGGETTEPKGPAVVFDTVAPDGNDGLVRAPIPATPMRDWVRPDDLPGVPEQITHRLNIAVAVDGRIATCTPEAETPLVLAACKQLRDRGKFQPALDRNGRAVAATVRTDLTYRPDPFPVLYAPPPFPNAPRYALDEKLLNPGKRLRLVSEPVWPEFPRDASKRDTEMVAVVYAFEKPFAGKKYPCSVIISSGDKALDDASCRGLEQASYERESSGYSGTATLMVRWTQGKAEVIRPSRAAGTDLSIDGSVPRPNLTFPPGLVPGKARLTFAADGSRVRCRVEESTGIDSFDLAACLHLETIRYHPAVDVFGRQREVTITVPIPTQAP